MMLNVEDFLEETALKIDKAIQKYLPKSFTMTSEAFRLIPPNYACNFETLNKAIADPIWEFLSRGGKRWRPALFLLVCEALGKNPDEFLDFATIPEVIHNGTLMIDDIEDSSQLRRGKPCTYRIYGLDIAINAGNAMYYLPLLPLFEHKQMPASKLLRVYETYTQEMIKLSLGQAMDIAWHRGLSNADEIAEKDYLQMCAYKTGTLARMSAKMAGILAGADEELTDRLGRFAESIGIAFQMQDDVLDLSSKKFQKKKGGQGQDITEGKRSLIVIHTLQVADSYDKKRLIQILNLHSSDQKVRDEAIAIMAKYGSMDYVKETARKMMKESWKQVEEYLTNPEGKEKLKAFAEFLIERNI